MADRSYYRLEEDIRLVEEAKYNPNRELAIALGERLEDVLVEMDEKIGEQKERARDAEIDANRLEDKILELERKVDMLEMALDQRDRVIAGLENALADEKLRAVQDGQDKLSDLSDIGDSMFEMRRRINELEAQLKGTKA